MRIDQPPFPNIDQEFFRKYGVKPADATWHKWLKFRADHSRAKDWAKYLCCLALCADCGEWLVKKWWSDTLEDHKQIREFRKAIFRKATVALGWKLPRPESEEVTDDAPPTGPALVALFTSLEVVSESYHLAVIRSIVRTAAARGLLLSIHELEWSHPVTSKQASAAELIVTRYAPQAVLMVRLTPSKDFLERMTFAGRSLPVVLIHSDRQEYPRPVLANVVPDHTHIHKELAGWLWSRPHIRGNKKPKVALVTMREEPEHDQFPPLKSIPRSIRNDRISCVQHAVDGFDVTHFHVDDYSFRHAFRVWEANPRADCYVCFSDQLAVGMKHLLRAQSYSEEECRNRIVGFDGSRLAQEENIVSISQDLDQIAKNAMEELCSFLEFRNRKEQRFPSAHEILVQARLANTD